MANANDLRADIERLAGMERESCSPGEQQAAEWIADAFRAAGATAEVEQDPVHGTYWWPLSITSAAGVLASALALRGHRLLSAAVGGVASAEVFDELGAGKRWVRRVLPKRVVSNVVAHAGDPRAQRTLLMVAHHDAAHTGVFFDPRLAEFVGKRFQQGKDPSPRHPPLMAPIAAAPAMAGLAGLVRSRRMALASACVCVGIIASLAEIARRETVPGANDNLSGVATLLGVARAIQQRPVDGLHLMFVSTGAEESLMEGMRAFATRHFHRLDPRQTSVLCIDTVGSPHLVLAEAEGLLRFREYDEQLKGLLESSAETLGITLRRGMRMRLGTDAYLALRHGLPAAMVMSVGEYGSPSNYHWPTDTPDRVDYRRLEETARLCEAVIRRLADS